MEFGQIIAIIIIVALCGFIGYFVYGLIKDMRAIIRKRKENKLDKTDKNK